MGREVRRVPMDWQHPTVWRERWDRSTGTSPMTLVPRPLFDDYAGSLADWEREKAKLQAREGSSWEFRVEYHLTGWSTPGSAEVPEVRPFHVMTGEGEVPVRVRDEDNLHELLMAAHESDRPDPADYMPEFPEGTATGWCMYETTSEGTPISPVLGTPEELAHWLADNGASTFGSMTTTYEHWLRMIRAGWAPSAVAVGGVLRSGVETTGGAS